MQGSGVGRVTVRFEEPWSRPGRVRTFAVDDPALEPADPLPLLRPAESDADAPAEDDGRGDGRGEGRGEGRELHQGQPVTSRP